MSESDLVKADGKKAAKFTVVAELEGRMVIPLLFGFEDGEFSHIYREDTHDLDDAHETLEDWIAEHGDVVYRDLIAYRAGEKLSLTALATAAAELSARPGA